MILARSEIRGQNAFGDHCVYYQLLDCSTDGHIFNVLGHLFLAQGIQGIYVCSARVGSAFLLTLVTLKEGFE